LGVLNDICGNTVIGVEYLGYDKVVLHFVEVVGPLAVPSNFEDLKSLGFVAVGGNFK
jgi:hypothetical protein